MYIVGIDIGKRNHEASIMDETGKQYKFVLLITFG